MLRNRILRGLIAMLDGFRDRGIRAMIGATVLVACAMSPSQAGAKLVLSPDGITVYDTVNNVTWVADFNLAATNRFGLPVCSGSSVNTKTCVNPSGSMSYQAATAWVQAMNAANYLGHTNWQLPTTPSVDNTGCSFIGPNGNSFGFNCSAGALGSLYYNALGLKPPNAAVSVPNNTVGPFSNLQPYYYWSQTATSGGHATFSFNTGFQDSNTAPNYMYVLPMIQGKLPGTPSTTGQGLQVNPGGQTVYDPMTNVTWLANANISVANAFGLPRCQDQSTPKPCVGQDGAMDWDSASQFVANMNSGAGYLGQTTWQLPPVDPSCPNYGCGGTLNPMGNLFYEQLGFTQGTPIVPAPNVTVGAFHNMQPYIYWSCEANTIQDVCGTASPATGFEFCFSFDNGFLGTDVLADEYYVTAYFVDPPLSAGAVITSLNPGSATAAGAAFTLTVNGTGFLSGATVMWNGAALPATFVSSAQLMASISASLIANPGSANIVVVNHDGTSSNTVTLPINAPAAAGPAITSVSPSSAPAGSPTITVTVSGTGFASGSVALWNGLSLITNYVSSSTLAAQIPAGDLMNQGTGQITVANPTGPASNSVPFVITSPSSLQFLTVAPCRIMDTRNPNGPLGGPFVAGGTTRTIPIPSSACGVPTNAAAYSLNFTVVPRAGTLGYLSVWPAGQAQPLVSTLNSPDGSVLANAAIVPAGTAGAINAYATNDTDLIVDINGYFVPPAANTLQFYSMNPCRILDTRNANGTFGGPSLAGGASRSFPIPSSSCVGAPASAAAYSLNVTVVPHGALGYLTAWPTGQPQPFVSTLNSFDGTILANAAIVPAGTGGAVSFFASDTTDLVVDINGYFSPPGVPAPFGLNFYPLAPCRLVDTRNAGGVMEGNTTRAFPLSGLCGLPDTASAQAYSLNMTVVPQGPLGYLTTWPTVTGGTRPAVSTLNASKGLVVANAAIVPAGSPGSIDVYVTNTTDVVIDTNGYFGQ